MKKKLILLAMCCMVFGLAACGSKDEKEGDSVLEPIPVEETAQAEETAEAPEKEQAAAQEQAPAQEQAAVQEQAEASSGVLTQEQALEAIKNYCYANNPDLESMAESDDYTIYWDVTTGEADEIVVLYISYTGAETRYYIDPTSGETYVTELVPGIIDEEQRTEESFNVRDYVL